MISYFGAIAQLGERLLCTQEVSGSIPLSSTRLLSHYTFAKKISSFENLARVCPGLCLGQILWRTEVDLEQSVEDSTEKIEKKSNEKGTGRMPWLQEAMKDVASCDKPRGEANIL